MRHFKLMVSATSPKYVSPIQFHAREFSYSLCFYVLLLKLGKRNHSVAIKASTLCSIATHELRLQNAYIISLAYPLITHLQSFRQLR